MSDLVCGVCLEPFDPHHVNHDMPLWQSKLFRAGKGCDCCHGVRPDGVTPEMAGRAVLNDIDDVEKMERIERACEEKVDYSAEWVAPPPLVVATCEGCGKKAEVDQEEIYPYYRNGKQVGRVVLWDKPQPYMSVTDPKLRHDVPIDEIGLDGSNSKWKWSKYDPDFKFSKRRDLDGQVLCSDCWTTCDSCGEEVYAGDAVERFCSDTYDAGNSFCSDSGGTLCLACVEEEYCDSEARGEEE